MGTIMRNGNAYGGGGGGGTTYTAGTGIEITDQDVINAKVVTLTQAEYDALVQQEEVDLEAVYYISDGVMPNSPVTDVKMNNVSIVSDHVANIPLVSSSTNGLVPQGTAVSTQSQSTKFLREDGSWAAPSYTTVSDKADIDGSNIANPSAFRQNIGLHIDVDVSCTSNASAYAPTGLSTLLYTLVQAYANGILTIPFDGGDGYWYMLFLKPSDMTRYANLNRSCTLIYIDN